MSKLNKIIFGIFLCFVLTGCSAPPKQELNYKSEIATTTTTNLIPNEVSASSSQENIIESVSFESIKEPNPQDKLYKVVKVVDGDTIDVDIDGKTERLRLIGINTPETVDPRKPVECFGKEASAKAKELLSGKNVKLEYDSTQDTRDKYGRLLAYVFREDGLFYNDWTIRNGYAYEYTYNVPYKYQSLFKEAQKFASDNQLGLWSPNSCQTETTDKIETPEQTISNHTFYTSSYRTSKYYYCDTDPGWKGLSPKYLKSFSSETELLKSYSRTLHEPCK